MSATVSREEYTRQIYRTVFHEGRMHLYEFETMMPEHLDLFFVRFEPILREWDTDQLYSMVFDLSHLQVSFSPYFKKRILTLIPLFVERNIRGKLALVVRQNAVGRVISTLSSEIQTHTQQRIEAQTFFDQAEALAWVAEELD